MILLLAYHPPNEPLPAGVTRKSLLKKIDYFGGFLAIAGLTILLYAFQTGEALAWSNAGVLAPLLVGFTLLGAFIYWETRAALPLIPIELFKANPRVMSVVLFMLFLAFILGSDSILRESIGH